MSLTVSEMRATNFKGLDEVCIRPTGSIVLIGGANGAGKSSVLDAMMSAFQGATVARDTARPIRDGEDRAEVRVEVSDENGNLRWIVTRRWSKDDAGTLTVTAPDGAKYGSPQKLLSETMGAVSFDPLAFLGQKGPEQVATLIGILGDSLGFDPEALEGRRQGIYDARTKAGRDVKILEGQLAGYAPHDAALPADETAASALMAEWQEATAHNEKRRRAWETVADYNHDVTAKRAKVEEAERALESARSTLEYMLREADTAEAYATELAPEVDVDAIRARLDEVDATNARIRAQQARTAVEQELADRRAEVETFTRYLEDIAREKATKIAAADLPVEGLSFDDTGVLYQGVPFSQASNAERLRVSAALGMSANPELRVMRIDNGEALDSASLRIIEELAVANDYQVWISRVDESGAVEFTIEAGRVRQAVAA